MASTSSLNSSEPKSERGPYFKPRSSTNPPEAITIIQPNEVHLIPLSHHHHHKFEATAQQTLYKSSTSAGSGSSSGSGSGPRRLTDDIIILTSNAGVILGRIPRDLSDEGLTNWLDTFIAYISFNKNAAWWHTDYQGRWTCYVFVPMDKNREKWMYYTNTEKGELRPLTILGMMDTYAQTKPWEVKLPGMKEAESYVAEIRGKCYVPTSSIPKPKRRRGGLQQQQRSVESWRSTEIRFMWDPDRQVRQVRLRDEEWRDELVLEEVDMSLI